MADLLACISVVLVVVGGAVAIADCMHRRRVIRYYRNIARMQGLLPKDD